MSAPIRIEGNFDRSIRILKGARQGCVTSPDFYNLYAEKILSHLEEYEGISVGGRNLNNLRYADDMTLMADSEGKRQRLLNVVVQDSGNRGLKVNIKKTFSMAIPKAKVPPKCSIFINGKDVQQVKSFSYLGSLITSDGKSEHDIKQRIGKAKTVFGNMKNVLLSHRINLTTRLRVLHCYVWSVLLYGCESWTISKVMKDRLMAVEVWFLQRMLKISRTEKKSNEEVFQEAGVHRTLLKCIRQRQLAFLGHVLRRQSLENLVVTGRIDGRRARGRQRLKYLNSLCDSLKDKVSPTQLIRASEDKGLWQRMVANVVDDCSAT